MPGPANAPTSTWALLGDGQISMLPRGVDEYLERRRVATATPVATAGTAVPGPTPSQGVRAGSSEERTLRKQLDRLDKQLARITQQEAKLNAEVEQHAPDYEQLADLGVRLGALAEEREGLELEWLEVAEQLDG